MSSVKELEINSAVYDIKGKTVVDNNSGELSFWSGTKAQYDAIQNKDSKCLYSITDDTSSVDIMQTILSSVYPVGSVYITTANTCPLSTLINGSTWELVSSGIVKAGNIPCKGNGKTLGLTDGTRNYGTVWTGSADICAGSNFWGKNIGYVTTQWGNNAVNNTGIGVTTDSSKSGIVADTSSLTLSVNIFERTA